MDPPTFQSERDAAGIFELTSEELDRYPSGVITLGRDGTILRYNRAESAISRLEPHRVIGKNFFTEVAPCTAVHGFQGRFEIFASGQTSAVERFDWIFMFRWGRQDVSITLMRRERRPEIHLVVTIRSMAAPVSSAAIEAIVDIVRERAATHARTNDTDVGIWEDDLASRTMYRSEAMHRILATGTELDAYPDPVLRYAHPKYVEALSSEIQVAHDAGRSYLLRTLVVAGDGAEKDVLVHGAFFDGEHGVATRSIGSIVDLTQRRTMEAQLWNSAHLDALTGLPNRRLLMERLDGATASPRAKIDLCFIDLDKFKHVNDSAGHAAGDHLLRLVAERLTNVLRPSDVVSRINGDEFVLILTNRNDDAEIDALLARVAEVIKVPYTIDGREHSISASIGVASYPADATTADDLLSAADAAMYRAKASGAGVMRRFTPAMRETALKDRDLATELAIALERNEVVPYFQAIVDARTQAIVGAEALARWNHPTRGTLEPSDFIALAERNGLIGELGVQMLRQACIAAKRWYDRVGRAAPFVSVNVSALQFRNRGFVALVRDVLASTQLPPEKLELELTESLIVDRFEETMLALADLKVLGVRLSIDDFGTGYSALAYLKYFPIDTIKLDRVFVEGIGIDTLDDSIVETIIALASKLHLTVIAEGVETSVQARRLAQLECPLLQGFFFSRPSPCDSFDLDFERAFPKAT